MSSQNEEIYLDQECDEEVIVKIREAVLLLVANFSKDHQINAREAAYALSEAMVDLVVDKSDGWYGFLEEALSEVIAFDGVAEGVCPSAILRGMENHSGSTH
jgi:hypothetical protein